MQGPPVPAGGHPGVCGGEGLTVGWIFGWTLLGTAAFVLAVVNLSRAALGRPRGWQILLFASLSCGLLALVCALLQTNDYVREWEASSLLDVVPTLAELSAWAACLVIALNFLALWLHLRRGGR